MKNKVVVFTQNNARILINPERIDRFEDKPNAFINPDLTFVNGVEPHFWKVIPKNKPMSLDEASRLRLEVMKVLTENQDSEAHSVRFYKSLLFILEQEIEACHKASNLVSKLLRRANGIEKEDVATLLHDSLIVHSKEPDKRKDNQLFNELISRWTACTIIPMDEEERLKRVNHVSKHGAVNSLEPKRSFGFTWAQYFITTLLLAALFALMLVSIKK